MLLSSGEGGVLSVSDATITVPAGAVDVDVEVTLARETFGDRPALDGADVEVLVVTPPMSLTSGADIVIRPLQEVPAGGSVELYFFTDGVWIQPDASVTVVDGELRTSLSFLGTFAAVVTSGDST